MSIKIIVVIAAVALFGIAVLSRIVKAMTLMIIIIAAAVLGLLFSAKMLP